MIRRSRVIEFIFMLTHDDVTVDNALAVYEQVRGTDLRYVGFKDIGASPAQLTEITHRAHEDGREVMLEVVSTSTSDELRSIEMASQIGVDWVLGGTHVTEALPKLRGSAIRYCPFPGRVTGHPSILTGDITEIADSARTLSSQDGVHGLDLLTYRHPSADPEALTSAVVDASPGPVIAAGSVEAEAQIQLLARSGAWAFTIGSAIFEGLLPGGPAFDTQVRSVLQAASHGRSQADRLQS
jgi:hypothetical protein